MLWCLERWFSVFLHYSLDWDQFSYRLPLTSQNNEDCLFFKPCSKICFLPKASSSLTRIFSWDPTSLPEIWLPQLPGIPPSSATSMWVWTHCGRGSGFIPRRGEKIQTDAWWRGSLLNSWPDVLASWLWLRSPGIYFHFVLCVNAPVHSAQPWAPWPYIPCTHNVVECLA